MNSEISSTSVAVIPASIHPLAATTIDRWLRQQDQPNSRDVVLSAAGTGPADRAGTEGGQHGAADPPGDPHHDVEQADGGQHRQESRGAAMQGDPRGGPLNDTGYGEVWQRARPLALTPAQQASPLARRPYDLRHAAVSLWLNSGVPATEVARRAGHGLAVLLRVYAHCIDGQAAAANQRISDALDHSSG